MSAALGAALASWSLPVLPVAAALLTLLVYARGFAALHARMPVRFPRWRALAFGGGMLALLVAIASPLEAFSGLLLQVHMVQHVLLTMAAPPLLWLGAPALPLLRGLPPRLARAALGPFLAWPALHRAAAGLAHPLTGWLALVLAVTAWHLPGPYQLALRTPAWHALEHAAFLIGGLLFWYPVVLPYPARARWPRWAMVPYLLLADVQNTVLAALLVFSERPLYPVYALVPRLGGVDVLSDQVVAGALMWVAGSAVMLAAAAAILVGVLQRRSEAVGAGEAREGLAAARGMALGGSSPDGAPPLTLTLPGGERRSGIAPRRMSPGVEPGRVHVVRSARARFDLLRVPGLGRVLRSAGVRRAAQAVMLLLAAAVIVDGLLGPRMSPMNLAGVLPWTYWRGLVVVALLAVGNAFCLACPFMLPRALARRLHRPQRTWPRRLRGKWLALALLVTYLVAYEVWDLWDDPRLTALITLSYVAAALVVDATFRGAAFCKHLCPIGQFHFVHATASPFTIAARNAATCRACTTHDCVRGRDTRPGCELELFVPEKRGNLDCTLCLDCVRACPHDNVGLLAVAPGAELATDTPRSSLRRLAERPDIAALALVCVFGAFANAAGMLAPVLAAEQALAARLGLPVPVLTASGLVLLLVVAPLAASLAAAYVGRRASGLGSGVRTLACRGALALIPLGLGMWSAHFLFHALSGVATVMPVAQRALADLGQTWAGTPAWASACAMSAPAWLTGLELLLLDAGLLVTLAVGWRTALDLAGGAPRRALALHAPWAAVALALWLAGIWIVFQPMQMRGMVH